MSKKILTNKELWLCISLVTTLALYGLGYHAINVMLLVMLLAVLIARFIAIDLITATVASLFAFGAIFGVVMNVFTIVQPSFDLFTAFSTLLPFLIFGTCFLLLRSKEMKKLRLYTKSSLLSFIVSIGVFIFLIQPFMTTYGIGNLISLLGRGEDHVSHFAIFHYIQHSERPAYFASEGIWRGLANYPQMPHGVAAYILSDFASLFKVNLDITDKLKTYVISMSCASALVTFLWGVLLLKHARARTTIEQVIIIAISFIFFTWILLPLVTHGYFGQIVGIGYLLLAGVITDAQSQRQTKNSAYIVGVVLGISGTLMSWYLATVVLVLVFAILMYKNRRRYATIILSSLVVAVSSVSMLLHIFVGKSTDAVIGSSGSPLEFHPAIYILFIFITVAVVSAVMKKRSLLSSEGLVISGAIALLLLGLVLFFKNGSLNYFFFKLLICIIVIAFALVATSLKCTIPYCSAVVIVCVAVLSLGYYDRQANGIIRTYAEKAGITGITKAEIEPVSLEIDKKIAIGTDTIYTGGCSGFSNYIVNRWTGALSLTNSDPRRQYETLVYYSKLKKGDISPLKYAPYKVGSVIDRKCQ